MVTEGTIANCFRKAGFSTEVNAVGDSSQADCEEEVTPSGWSTIATIPFSDFVSVDDGVYTATENSDETIVEHVQNSKSESKDSESEDDEETPA